MSSVNYNYAITPIDLQTEQQAFEAGENVSYIYYMLSILSVFPVQKTELVPGFGVYIKYIDLEQAEQTSKSSATGLMRALISVFYSRER